jgi:hypothetical protein
VSQQNTTKPLNPGVKVQSATTQKGDLNYSPMIKVNPEVKKLCSPECTHHHIQAL